MTRWVFNNTEDEPIQLGMEMIGDQLEIPGKASIEVVFPPDQVQDLVEIDIRFKAITLFAVVDAIYDITGGRARQKIWPRFE